MSFKHILFIVLIAVNLLSAQEAAVEIVKKSNELIRAKSSLGQMRLTIVKPDWQRTMGMKIWALEPDFSLIYITEPARDKGTVTLKRKQEVWNYLPTVQKTIKIPPSMMLQSWMGSDFTNDDLVRASSIVEDYNHSLEKKEEFNGYMCYKIKLIPKPEAGVVWGKIYLWITQKGYMQLKAEYYDEDEWLIKSMIGSEIKKMGGRTFPTRWEMIPEDKPGQKTVMEYLNIEFNKNLNKRFFSQKNMKRVR